MPSSKSENCDPFICDGGTQIKLHNLIHTINNALFIVSDRVLMLFLCYLHFQICASIHNKFCDIVYVCDSNKSIHLGLALGP